MNVFDKAPVVDKDAFVAPSASVIGDVQVGKGASIWYGCVLRGKSLYVILYEIWYTLLWTISYLFIYLLSCIYFHFFQFSIYHMIFKDVEI